MVGLSIMLAWGAVSIALRWPGAKPAIVALAAVACSACVAIAWVQFRARTPTSAAPSRNCRTACRKSSSNINWRCGLRPAPHPAL